MLSIYQAPRRRSEDSDSTIELERVIPPGQPYLTKVNGKLVMARGKRPKTGAIALDLLGEAFGSKTRLIRTRTKSLDKPRPLVVGGVPYIPQQQVTHPPYTTPLPQQAFPTQNLIPYAPQPAFFLPNPSQQDINQLHQMQAHFRKMHGYGAPNNSQNGKVEVTTTTITITKHICAGCGRIRSKKYHHDHPLKEGEKPDPDFCRRCQKDTSSTDSDGESKERKKEGKKTKHKKPQKKYAKQSSDDEDSDSPAPKAHKKPKHTGKKAHSRVPSEDYIIVEEEISEEGILRPRGRGRIRERVVGEVEVRRYPPSRQSSQPRRRSASRKVSREIPRKPVPPPKIRETILRETIRRRSPSIEYRYVDVERKSPISDARAETYPRKIPVHFYDDLVHGQQPPPRDDYREHGTRERGSSGKEYSIEEAETASRGHASRDHYQEHSKREQGQSEKYYVVEGVEEVGRRGPSRDYYEEREVIREPPIQEYHERDMTSIRAEEARQRRRRERNSPTSITPPWDAPHVIHPTGNEDLIVVTERYEYRPKKRANLEEDRRKQEFVDRVTLDHQQANQFSAEEAARYYHEDWSRVEPESPREPLRRTERHEPNYRRRRYRDAELNDSEASYEYRTYPNNPPRAPSPPSAIYDSRQPENWPAQPPYPLSSDSEVPQGLNSLHKGKGFEYSPPHNIPRDHERSRSRSTGRPAYVREVIDGGTEKALVASPKRSRSRGGESVRYVEVTESELEMAERERRAESEARHVSFRETPTMLSMQNSWTETSELGPVDPERERIAERVASHVTFRETPTMLSGVSANSWTESSELGPVHPETTGSGWGHRHEHGERGGWNR